MRRLRVCLRAALLALALGTAASAPAQPRRLTSRDVIARIQKNVGVEWKEPTVDTFKAGDPDRPVTGVAVTMMATLAVLKRAAAAGCNLVITHEPTFYDHRDETATLEGENDAVLAAKQKFIREHGLVVFRFHDYWHARRPDGIYAGMIRALGWERWRKAGSDRFFVTPGTTVGRLASDIKRRLRINAVRIVGATKIFALAESLGGGESLVEVPQAMTHQSVEDSDAAVPADLVRLSCGIEDAADLVEDLDQAIQATA